MSENVAVVVSRPEQADHAWRSYKENAVFFCVSILCYEYCQQKKYRSVLVDDALLYDSHKAINQWGFEGVFNLFSRLKTQGKERVFLESIFTGIKAVFVQISKTALVLESLLKRQKIREVVFFEDERPVFLWTCLEYLKQFHPDVSVCLWPSLGQKEFRLLSFRKLLLKHLAFVNNIFFRMFFELGCAPNEVIGLASGALNHLDKAIVRIHRRKGHRIIYCEDSFNFQKFKFCFKNQIAFFVLPVSQKAFIPDLDQQLSFPAGTFVFEGRDFSAIVSAVLKNVFSQGIYGFSYDYESALLFFKRYDIQYCFLDEDSVQRRIFAVLAWHLGKRSYVVSHGVPVVLMPPGPKASLEGRYPSSVTFVNSEFEKFAYQRICFDSKKLIVTGMPRYDSMFFLQKDLAMRKKAVKSPVKQILYCGTLLKDFDFSFPIDVIGSNNYSGFHTKRYVEDIFLAASRLKGVCLKIKPHYNDEDLWQKLLSSFEKKVPYELLTHKANIFKLLLEADLVITPESTVIFEAIILKKPVIVLNYSPEDLCLPYEDDGLILQAKNPRDLTRMVRQALEDQDYLKELAMKREECFVRYTGEFDGYNADRVADYITRSEVCSKNRSSR